MKQSSTGTEHVDPNCKKFHVWVPAHESPLTLVLPWNQRNHGKRVSDWYKTKLVYRVVCRYLFAFWWNDHMVHSTLEHNSVLSIENWIHFYNHSMILQNSTCIGFSYPEHCSGGPNCDWAMCWKKSLIHKYYNPNSLSGFLSCNFVPYQPKGSM